MNVLLSANHALLEDAVRLLEGLDDAAYTRPMPEYASGSIGQHLRHILDHYHAILTRTDDLVDYDARRRDSALESSRARGILEIRRILAALRELRDAPVRVRSETSPTEKAVLEAGSTVRRELLFATSHAVHHFALIAMLLRINGVSVPAEFGVAPATLTYQRELRQSA